MTISPLAGLPSPFTGQPQWQTFRPETGYEFRFDTNNNAKPDVVFITFEGDKSPQTWMLTYIDEEDAHDHHSTGCELGRGIVNQITSVAEVGRI